MIKTSFWLPVQYVASREAVAHERETFFFFFRFLIMSPSREIAEKSPSSYVQADMSTKQAVGEVRVPSTGCVWGVGGGGVRRECLHPGSSLVFRSQALLLSNMLRFVGRGPTPSCSACVLSPPPQKKRPCKQPPSHLF